MENPEKMATYGTEDEKTKNRNTTQHMLDTTMRKQTQITSIRYEPSYKQLEVKTNRTMFVCGNRNRQDNTKLRI